MTILSSPAAGAVQVAGCCRIKQDRPRNITVIRFRSFLLRCASFQAGIGNEILEKLQTDRRVVVSELSQIYEVSEETIRRDLDKLVNDGYAIKSYGGAVINENMNIDLPFNIRKNRNVIGKQRIAELVAKIVQDGDSIMLDASSTAVYIAKGLKDKKNLTLITNSMEIVIELLDMSDWRVLSTGGVSREGSFALVGTQTNRMLQSYHADKAIISCKGLDMAAGLTDSDELLADKQTNNAGKCQERILAMYRQ